MEATFSLDHKTEAFVPPPFLKGPHAQTIWAARVKPAPRLRLRRERHELADGDYLSLLWGQDSGGPLVLVLHGLTGDANSPYVRRLVEQLELAGLTPVVMEARGCGGRNALMRFQHAGATEDLEDVIRALRERHPERALAAVGYSLGGSILLNTLGRSRCDLDAACAVSVPFELGSCADALEQGFARIYQANLLQGLKRMMTRKLQNADATPIALSELRRLRSLREFDDRITAPLHGFSDSADYYHRASCRPHLANISRPTLLIQAEDDPFVPRQAIPAIDDLSPSTSLYLSEAGGHVGFVAQGNPRWLEQQIIGFIKPRLELAGP